MKQCPSHSISVSYTHLDVYKRQDHGASSVGDDNELGIPGQLVKVSRKAVHIGIIQGRLNLIQQTKRRRFQILDSKKKGLSLIHILLL